MKAVHHRLDRHPHGDRRVRPALGCQPHQPEGLEAALPVIDHRHLNIEECGYPARTETDFEELDDPPACLLFRGLFAIRAESQEKMLGSQGLEQALGVGGWVEREVKLLMHGERRQEACCVVW